MWPMRIFFLCVTPPQQGGETPIADVQKIFQRLPESIQERFRQKKALYVRNFGNGFGLPWQDIISDCGQRTPGGTVSFAQEWMWLFEQIASPAYNLLFALWLTGPLNREILERSLNALLQRHEVLRTTLTFEHEQL
jgi:hypothetical protein